MQNPSPLPENFFVHEDIEQSESLPAEAFMSGDLLSLERENLFKNAWLMLPEPSRDSYASDPRSTTQRVTEPSSHAPLELEGRPLFLKRDTQGILRLFPNVCTHAWYPLVTECGTSKGVVCGQHGRRFNDQGQYVSQPSFGKLPNFPRPCDHLQSMPLKSFGPWLFATLGTPEHDFETVFKPIRESISKMDIENWPRQLQQVEERMVPGNWKQHAWNFMDKFHIPFIHRGPKGLVDALHYRDYRTELYDGASLQWAYARKPEHGFEPEQLPERFQDPDDPSKRVFALWWFIFPNLTLNFYPWGVSLNRYEPVPGKPDQTNFFWHHYVADSKKYEERETVWLNNQVDEEDVVAMDLVSKGIKSGLGMRGRFAPEEEKGPHWFHREVYRQIFEYNP